MVSSPFVIHLNLTTFMSHIYKFEGLDGKKSCKLIKHQLNCSNLIDIYIIIDVKKVSLNMLKYILSS